MKKIKYLLGCLGLFVILANCGGGSDSGSDDDSATGTESFSDSGSSLTIDDIVNGSSSSSSLNTSFVTVSSSAPFYFGRFIYYDSSSIFTGAVKFKVNKNDDDSAYFSDFSLEYLSEVLSVSSSDSLVTDSTDLDVDPDYDSSSNQITIANATSRFVAFDIDFGNNDYFSDIEDAGVFFSADFSTMVGGNNSTFFFIAQKVTSQPDVSSSAIEGDWAVITFSVGSTGSITANSTASVSIGGTGGNGFTGFTGTNSSSGDFDGELSLTDATAGCFMFGYGSGDGTMTALGINGGFLVSADQNLAVGIDLSSGLYFAAE